MGSEMCIRDSYHINGSKIWITNSACELTKGITMQAVSGKTEKGRNSLSCFLVEPDAKGLKAVAMKDKMMWRSSNTGELYLNEVKVHESHS